MNKITDVYFTNSKDSDCYPSFMAHQSSMDFENNLLAHVVFLHNIKLLKVIHIGLWQLAKYCYTQEEQMTREILHDLQHTLNYNILYVTSALIVQPAGNLALVYKKNLTISPYWMRFKHLLQFHFFPWRTSALSTNFANFVACDPFLLIAVILVV